MTHTRERENKKLFQSRDECDTRGRGTKRGELKFIEKKFSSRSRISFLPISQRVLLAMINYNSIQPQNHTAWASNPSLLRVILIQDVSGLSSIIRPRPIVQRLDNAIRWMHRYPVDSAVRFLNSYPLDSDFFCWIALSTLWTTGPRSITKDILLVSFYFHLITKQVKEITITFRVNHCT